MNQFSDLIPEPADANREQRYNPPGQKSLSYRVGTYASFIQRMLDSVRAQTNPDDPSYRPLRTLNTQADRDLVVSLLKAWAAVGDILTFYQERIANEGYLSTATELRSVRELVRAIGYELSPGVAASTYLSFTLLDAKGAPDRLTIPQGTAVQSIPKADPQAALSNQLPITFETSAAIEARVQWNTLKPYILNLPQPYILDLTTTELCIKGIRNDLLPSKHILIADRELQQNNHNPSWYFRQLEKVELDRDKGYTRLIWNNAPGETRGGTLTDPQVFVFHQPAALFGYKAPQWSSLSDSTKQNYATRRGGIFSTTDSGQSWQAINQGLTSKAIRALVFDQQGVLFAATAAGVFRSVNQGQNWEPVNLGLTRKDAHTLLVNKQGHLFVGTAGGAVFRSLDRGDSWTLARGSVLLKSADTSWKPVNARLPNTVVRSLTTATAPKDQKTYLFAGTDNGILYSVDSGTAWYPCCQGLPGWDADTGLASIVTYALAVDTLAGCIFAGTDRGMFFSQDYGQTWQAASISTGIAVYSLLITQVNDRLYRLAGTESGIFESHDGKRWQPTGSLLPAASSNAAPVVVRSLAVRAVDQKTYLFAGSDRGVFRSEDEGKTWIQANTELQEIQTLALSLSGQLVAGTLFTGFTETEWPNFHIQNSQIDLDKTYTGVLQGSWVVLKQNQTAPLPPLLGAYRAEQVSVTPRQAFSQSGIVTRIETQADDTLSAFNLRDTFVFAQSEEIDLYEEQVAEVKPFQGNSLQLDGVIQELQPGQVLSVTGKRLSVRILADNAALFAPDGQAIALNRALLFAVEPDAQSDLDQGNLSPVQTAFKNNGIPLSPNVRLSTRTTGSYWLLDDAVKDDDPVQYSIRLEDGKLNVYKNDLLELLVSPSSVANSTAMRVYLRTKLGAEGWIQVEPKDFSWAASGRDNAVVGEVVFIQQPAVVSPSQEYTTVYLTRPLQYFYDPLTVSLSANVAPATHGETVTAEVLGSGNAARAHQRFVLKKPPLTYVTAPTPTGVRSTLEIRVKSGSPWQAVQIVGALTSPPDPGVLWHEVPSLFNSTPSSREYMLRVEDEGKLVVIFGDGEKGVRLPSGVENVEATYRSGIGVKGNLEPDSLTLLRQGPPGIRRVSNLIAASGGTDPETMDNARTQAPLTVRTLGRIVSLQDYEDFSRSFAGVGKAQVKLLWNGKTHLVHLTVAATDGSAITPTSALYTNLVGAIATNRASPQPFQLESFQPLLFNLDAQIIVQPDYEVKAVQTAIIQRVTATFSFKQRELGQAVTAAEAIALIQQVPGVVAVDLTALYLLHTPRNLASRLPAESARWHRQLNQSQPAQLLLIASTGINLTFLDFELKPHNS